MPDQSTAVTLRDGSTVHIRAIASLDREREQAFVRKLSSESRYFRFMNSLRELDTHQLERFIHPDPAHEIVLVALSDLTPDAEQLGVARCAWEDQASQAEFAVAVADAVQGKGLGSALLRELVERARQRGLARLEGLVLANNYRMLELMRSLGFRVFAAPEDATLRRVVKDL